MNASRKRREKTVKTAYKGLEFVIAGLLLTGQLTLTAIFITRDGGYGFSLTGAIVGDIRTEARPSSGGANAALDFIDVVVALLLILGQIHLIGVFLGQGMFNIIIGGPATGMATIEAFSPTAKEFFGDFRTYVTQEFRGGGTR